MVIHVNDISLTGGAVIASVRFKWFQNALETLILIFGKVWLPTVQQRHKTLISFHNQLLQIE